MHDILPVFALDDPAWTIPWAGIGALLLGLGSLFSGIAAFITARSNKEQKNEARNTDSDGVRDGVRQRVLSGDSPEPGTSGPDPDSNN